MVGVHREEVREVSPIVATEGSVATRHERALLIATAEPHPGKSACHGLTIASCRSSYEIFQFWDEVDPERPQTRTRGTRNKARKHTQNQRK